MVHLSALVGDRARLAVLGSLAAPTGSAGLTSEELVARSGLDRLEVLGALGELRSAGVVTAEDGRYRFDGDAWSAAAAAAAEAELPMDPIIGYGMTDEERSVLGRYFSGRILHEVPTHRAKRLIVLQRLALEFEPGRRFRESEVNEVLGVFHRDWSTLRRHLVDEGFLDRESGEGTNWYWRSGGRVTDLPPG